MHTHPAPGGCGAGQASQRRAQRDLAKPNFPPGSPGPPDTSTESIFRRAWKAPVFWDEAEPQSQRQPRAVPGHGVHRAPPSVSCASDGGGQKPTSGPPPRWPAPPPWPRWQVCGTGSGSGAQIHRTGSGLRQRPRLRPARSFPLARASGCRPAPASRPLPGRGAPPGAPSPARPQRPKAGRHWEGEGGDPSPHGGAAAATSLLQPPPPGSRGVVTGAGTLRSGLAARLLKGVRSGGSRRRCCHRAAVATTAADCA